MKRRFLGIILVIAMIFCAAPQMAFAEPDTESKTAKRTILLYVCGSNLESNGGMATYNFLQILKSKFSADGNTNIIVLTGGSKRWQLDDDDDPDNENGYLVFPDDIDVPDDAVEVADPEDPDKTIPADKYGSISGKYNQLWEARGADAAENAGKLVLLDGDGITGGKGEAIANRDELTSDPETLKAFINYGVDNYPAEKYDLILWDHGGGPQGGFGGDRNFDKNSEAAARGLKKSMPFAGIVDALGDNKVVDSDGDGVRDGKFDFVDFDACLMGSAELALILADYTEYYIASPDTEPGYGQYYGPGTEDGKYTGWISELGRDPEIGTFDLGKIIVDDIYTFYSDEDGDAGLQDATLAVYDTEKMLGSGLISLLSRLDQTLKAEAEGEEGKPLMFYDELRSYFKSIHYSDSQLYDLSDTAAFLGTVDTETDESADPDSGDYYRNAYSEIAEEFSQMFPREGEVTENDFMYAKCTLSEHTDYGYYYKKDGEGEGIDRMYGLLFSSGLSMFFPDPSYWLEPARYYNAMDPVLEKLPEDDARRILLRDHEEVVADYNTILLAGSTVSNLLNNEVALYPEENPAYGDKSRLDFDLIMDSWKSEDSNMWEGTVKVDLSKRAAGVEGSEAWLRKLIDQQIDDALMAGNIDVTEETYKDKEGYKIKLNQGSPRIFDSVKQEISAELPALEEYIRTLPEKAKAIVTRHGILSIGTVEGYYNEGSIWEVPPFEQKWYAVKDENGGDHVASVYRETDYRISVPALFGTSEDGEEEDRLVFLEFSKEDNNSISHNLKSLYFAEAGNGPMRLDPASLTGDLTVMPILYFTPLSIKSYYAPISKTSFVINKDNAASITLDLMDVKDITDIKDTTGDGKPLNSAITVTDIYGRSIDITQRINSRLKHISLAEVKPASYTGKELIPKVTCDGRTLEEGVDYTWDKVPDVIGEGENERFITPEFKNVRKYEVLLTGKGDYTGFAYAPFEIRKAVNPLSVKGRTAKVSGKKLRKKTLKLTWKKVIRRVKAGKGTTTYAKMSKGKKFKKITVSKKTGKVTLKKGLKKGTYKVKIKVRAAGTSNYKAKSRTVTVRIKVS